MHVDLLWICKTKAKQIWYEFVRYTIHTQVFTIRKVVVLYVPVFNLYIYIYGYVCTIMHMTLEPITCIQAIPIYRNMHSLHDPGIDQVQIFIDFLGWPATWSTCVQGRTWKVLSLMELGFTCILFCWAIKQSSLIGNRRIGPATESPPELQH